MILGSNYKYKILALFILYCFTSCDKKKDIKIDVNIFLSPQCPLSEAVTLNIKQLDSIYNNKININLIFPGKLYSKHEIDSFIFVHDLRQQVIYDTTAVLVEKYNATITPEVFLLKNNVLVYSGAIDDKALDNDVVRQVSQDQYLLNAIEKCLKDELPDIKQTKAVGCYIEL